MATKKMQALVALPDSSVNNHVKCCEFRWNILLDFMLSHCCRACFDWYALLQSMLFYGNSLLQSMLLVYCAVLTLSDALSSSELHDRSMRNHFQTTQQKQKTTGGITNTVRQWRSSIA